MNAAEIVSQLEGLGDPKNVAGMARYGIVPKKAFGIAAPELKRFAREIKKTAANRHELALELWSSGIHEARALAFLIDDPKKVTERQMDLWVEEFDNWAICDSTCGTLFSYTPLARKKALEWSDRDEEFVKRAGIVLMAWIAVHDKKAADARIAAFLPILEAKADDDRNFIKKAVNWSLRQIGKRNINLNALAIESAERIRARGTRSARWIAADALRELRSEKVRERLGRRETAGGRPF